MKDMFYLLATQLFPSGGKKSFPFTNQPEDDDDDEDDEDEGEPLWVSSPLSSVNITDDDDVISFSFSFLLPVQTDLWAGLNCHVTFVDACSTVVDRFTGEVTRWVAMGMVVESSRLLVTPVSFLALPLLFLSCSVKSSLSTSGSVVSPNKSQPGSACSFDRDVAAALFPAEEILGGRLGSESDRSESQSLSPATEPQPRTDMSPGPDPELSESDSLKKTQQAQSEWNHMEL